MSVKRKICEPAEIRAAIDRMAAAVIKAFEPPAANSFALVGIYKQGVPLARRLGDAIEQQSGFRPELAMLDISMYRDDFGMHSALPLINETIIPFDMNASRIILVDDVLSSGRTIRAALDAVTDYGRPELIRLAVLVDRRQPEYPIRADFAGIEIDAPPDRKLLVEFVETDGADGIFEVEWR